jgi:hypothetical protein
MKILALATLLVMELSSFGAKAAIVDPCFRLLAAPPSTATVGLRAGHWRLFFSEFEVDFYIGAVEGQMLDNSYFVVGSNQKRESIKSAIKNIRALERYELSRFYLSPNGQRVTLDGPEGLTVTVNLKTPYTTTDELDIRTVQIKWPGRQGLPKIFNGYPRAPVAVAESSARVHIYEGVAAAEILQLIAANGIVEPGGSAYYRGLHFIGDKELHAPLYLMTYVEVGYLLRGLRALKLRRDHPIFRSLVD